MTIVNFYASKLTTRKAWKEQKRDYIKFNMIKQMMVEAYYHSVDTAKCLSVSTQKYNYGL